MNTYQVIVKTVLTGRLHSIRQGDEYSINISIIFSRDCFPTCHFVDA